MSLARRTVAGLGWQSGSGLLQAGVLFGRSILLARLLPVEVFGVYAGATVAVELVAMVGEFGLGGALIHRSPATEDEETAAAVHFTLTALFSAVWATLLAGAAVIWLDGSDRLALLVVTAAAAAGTLARTPRMLFIRRVAHRRLAAIDLADDLATTAVAVVLALRGATLWALLATNVTGALTLLVLLHGWRPIWRPRLLWSRPIVAYFLQFGARNAAANTLSAALDRCDDLFTRWVLGEYAMGLYSRAYMFATYPRRILAVPAAAVALGAYAELKGDRAALSRTFFRINALLVRAGFGMAGALALIAPEFVLLVIGDKWLPFVPAFRLMLIFTLLDPLKQTVADLFVGLGDPGRVARVRLWQLGILLVGLALLGRPYGIVGVALAVDLMLVVGVGLLLWQARAVVDFSPVALFGAPLAALAVGLAAGRAAIGWLDVAATPWLSAAVKLGVFAVLYAALLLTLERRRLAALWRAFPRAGGEERPTS